MLHGVRLFLGLPSDSYRRELRQKFCTKFSSFNAYYMSRPSNPLDFIALIILSGQDKLCSSSLRQFLNCEIINKA